MDAKRRFLEATIGASIIEGEDFRLTLSFTRSPSDSEKFASIPVGKSAIQIGRTLNKVELASTGEITPATTYGVTVVRRVEKTLKE